MMKHDKYRVAYIEAGWECPQIQIQIQVTPFKWGLGSGAGANRFSLLVGPLAIAVWFKVSRFEARGEIE